MAAMTFGLMQCGPTTPGTDAGAEASVPTDSAAAETSVPTGEEFHGCTDAMFVDMSAETASRQVMFEGLAYTPKCMLIAAGQTVTFAGSFSSHPLRPGSSPTTPTAGSPSNPIVDTNDGSVKMVTFPAAGTYPYFCQLHFPTMSGVIRVR